MTLGPNGITALEMSNSIGTSQTGTTGQTPADSKSAAVPSNPANHWINSSEGSGIFRFPLDSGRNAGARTGGLSIPAAMQLRYLQTLTEIDAERSSTVVFPMPIDIIKPFLDIVEKTGKPAGANGATTYISPAKDAPLAM